MMIVCMGCGARYTPYCDALVISCPCGTEIHFSRFTAASPTAPGLPVAACPRLSARTHPPMTPVPAAFYEAFKDEELHP